MYVFDMQTKCKHCFDSFKRWSCIFIVKNNGFYIETANTVLMLSTRQASADDMSKSNKICKKCQHFGISCPYLESSWEMHSNKYQHAWYWFSKSWNSCSNFRNERKQTRFCSVKPMPRVLSVKYENIGHYVLVVW